MFKNSIIFLDPTVKLISENNYFYSIVDIFYHLWSSFLCSMEIMASVISPNLKVFCQVQILSQVLWSSVMVWLMHRVKYLKLYMLNANMCQCWYYLWWIVHWGHWVANRVVIGCFECYHIHLFLQIILPGKAMYYQYKYFVLIYLV